MILGFTLRSITHLDSGSLSRLWMSYCFIICGKDYSFSIQLPFDLLEITCSCMSGSISAPAFCSTALCVGLSPVPQSSSLWLESQSSTWLARLLQMYLFSKTIFAFLPLLPFCLFFKLLIDIYIILAGISIGSALCL